MIFSHMCQAVAPIVTKIQCHPFNLALAQGSLPKETFVNYLAQDALFLNDFAKALTVASARLDAPASKVILNLALGTIEAEQALHRDYLHPLCINPDQIEKNPACFMYTNFVLCMSTHGSIEEAVASLLPCFWIYQIVGQHIAMTKAPNNPYHAWIKMYSSETFQQAVHQIIDITNELAKDASPSLQAKMVTQFKRATELEWLFWDDAFKHTPWIGASLL